MKSSPVLETIGQIGIIVLLAGSALSFERDNRKLQHELDQAHSREDQLGTLVSDTIDELNRSTDDLKDAKAAADLFKKTSELYRAIVQKDHPELFTTPTTEL